MYNDRDIARLLRVACNARWAGRCVAGPAEQFGWPKDTVASWLSGRRRMPADKMAKLAKSLLDHPEPLRGFGEGLAYAAEKARARGRRARGFQIVKDWDGTGFMTDRRWRGGRGKMKSTLNTDLVNHLAKTNIARRRPT